MINRGILQVSPLTKQRLEELKKTDREAGMNSTMGGIVDKLVANEYKRVKKTV